MIGEDPVENQIIFLVLLKLVEFLLDLVYHQVHRLQSLLHPGGVRLYLEEL